MEKSVGRAWALLCVVVLLMGCTAAPETRFDVVRVSPEFTPEEQTEIAAAVAEWCAASADLCVPVELDSRAPNVHRRTGPNDRSGVLSGPPLRLDVWVEVTASVWRTVAHEMGHSWRGDGEHLSSPGLLMHEESHRSARCVDAPSIEFVCQRAGCRAHKSTCEEVP